MKSLIFLTALSLCHMKSFSQNCLIDQNDYLFNHFLGGNEIFGNDKVVNCELVTSEEYNVKDYFGEVTKQEKKSTWNYIYMDGVINSVSWKGKDITDIDFYSIVYNDNGKLIEVEWWDKVAIIEYNTAGIMTEEALYNIHSTLLIQKIIYEYAANKRTESYYDEKGNLESKYIYKFDVKCNITELNKYSSDGKLYYTEINKFDGSGNRINSDVKYHNDNSRSESLTMTYDKFGNVLTYKAIKTDGESTEFKYEYKYDLKNNWIEKISYRNFVPYLLEERKITY